MQVKVMWKDSIYVMIDIIVEGDYVECVLVNDKGQIKVAPRLRVRVLPEEVDRLFGRNAEKNQNINEDLTDDDELNMK